MNTVSLGNEILFIDGGLSTELEAMGVDLNNALWSARGLLDNPDSIYQVHKNYFDAGANIAVTSTYQASLEGFQKLGLSADQSRALIQLGIELADQARTDFLAEQPNGRACVAASIGPYAAYLADGSEYRGNYQATTESIHKLHTGRIEAIQQLADQFDFWAIETLPSLDEALMIADILAADPHPAWFSFTLRDEGHIPEGVSLAEVAKVLDKNPSVAAIGINCCHPDWVEPALKTIARQTSKPLVAYPNGGGEYDASTKEWKTPEEMKLDGKAWIAAGARLIGGCCQTCAKSLGPLYADWARLTNEQ